MSLENVIAENTQAINNLAELIRQAMHMAPPTAPAPVTPQAAPDNGIYVPPKPAPEPKAASNEPVAAADLPPAAAPAPAPEPKPEPKAAPALAINPVELREAMVSKLQKLFEHSPAKGAEILHSFGVRRQSELPDEKTARFLRCPG